MKRIICLLTMFASCNSLAFDKTIAISGTKNIDYEIPESWSVVKKQVPASSAIQMLRISHSEDFLLEIMLFDPPANSPLRKQSINAVTSTMQSTTCDQYIQGSVEGKDTKTLHQSEVSDGYLSLYTDKSNSGYKYVTCVTYVLKDADFGINMNATLLSNNNSGEQYEEILKAINTFRVRSKQ